ncbi:ParB/RepB/Spo0J family partition protein [Polaromonas glacialis]|uniref:ParB/RepB/Spo0J family partition protein n=1 Tax=Polaromonas glacialis TaxID=866564 RepID=UPI000A036FC9|nr:ParB/RepB/Spo0J family partition protein [Polaromonas glacialis]
MHTEPTHPSVDTLPPTTTKPNIVSAGKKAKPSRTATPKAQAAKKNGMHSKAATVEVPLPVLSMTYYGKPVKLDPALVQLSPRANRMPCFVDTPDFKELMSLMIATGGNTVPVLVRLLPDSSHELVYGHRRLKACEMAGLKVNALIARSLTNEQAVRAMAHENTARHDLSPLEKGRWYAQLRKERVYETDGALSRALGVDKGDVSNALALSRLRALIIKAFSSPHDLQYRFAKGLTDASKYRPIYQRALAIGSLRSSATPSLDGRAVYEMLLGKRLVQPPAAHARATNSIAMPSAVKDVLDGTSGLPEKAVQCLPAATEEGVMVSGETDPPAGDVVGPSNTWHRLFSDPQPEVSAVTALPEDVAQCPPAAMPEDDMAVDQTASLEGPSVGPSNIGCPILTHQPHEAGVAIETGSARNAGNCLPAQALEGLTTAGENLAPKEFAVGPSSVWCPVINAEADEVGAVSVGQQGKVLIQLHVWLSPQQCDLLAVALGELLSHEAYKCPGLAHPLTHGQKAS